jgi:quinol monooxygenase YgiN
MGSDRGVHFLRRSIAIRAQRSTLPVAAIDQAVETRRHEELHAMAQLYNRFTAYESYSKLKVLFHKPLEQMPELFITHVEAVQMIPGCQKYTVRHSENPQFHIIFVGIWDCPKSTLGYYQGDELQVLISALMKTGARVIEFEEIAVL